MADMDTKRSAELAKALTRRERDFVREYLVDMNGTQAAIRTGYRETTAASAASRMLRKESVRAYRDALLAEAFEDIGVTRHTIAAEVWAIFKKCTQKEPVLEWNSVAREWEPGGEWQFNVKGALKALEMLNGLLPQLTEGDEGEETGSLEQLLANGTGGRKF